MVLFPFDNVIYVFLLLYVFLFYIYVWLPWLRFFRAFSSVVRKMPGSNPQRRGTAHTLPNFRVFLCFLCCTAYFFVLFCVFFVLFCVFSVLFYVILCCSMYCLFCVVLCIVCVYMCTVLLPPGGYPIAVKYITSHQYNMNSSHYVQNKLQWH
jgi:hypothetical protein